MPDSFLIRKVAGGVFMTKVNDLSAKAVITTGIGMPGSIPWVCALNALQNSMMFRPRCPSAGPIGGDGFALPAGTCSLIKPMIFFAMIGSYLGLSSSAPRGDDLPGGAPLVPDTLNRRALRRALRLFRPGRIPARPAWRGR